MKDYEMMEEMASERHSMVSIHKDAIRYHIAKIKEIRSTTIEDDFYLGNSEFPDYPGNEWLKEILDSTEESRKKEIEVITAWELYHD